LRDIECPREVFSFADVKTSSEVHVMTLFPFADYWWFYGIFTLFVLGLLALDLGVFHKKEHAVSFKEAAAWSAI